MSLNLKELSDCLLIAYAVPGTKDLLCVFHENKLNMTTFSRSLLFVKHKQLCGEITIH